MSSKNVRLPRPIVGRRAWIAAGATAAIGCIALLVSVESVERADRRPASADRQGAPQTGHPVPPVADAGRQGNPTPDTRTAATDPGTGAVSTPPVPIQNAGVPVIPHEATEARPTGVDLAALKQGIDSYRRGEIATGDQVKRSIADPSAQELLEWIAIRTNGRAVGLDRLLAFLNDRPNWPGDAVLRRRIEEALYYEKRPQAMVLSFFATRQPVSNAGRLALAAAQRAQGRTTEAADLIRAVWREDFLSKDTEQDLMRDYPQVLNQGEHRNRMEHFLFAEKWDLALRAAGYAGNDYIKLAKARIAVVDASKTAQAALDAVPAALHADSSYAFSRAHYLRKKEQFADAAKIHNEVTRDPAVLVDGDEWWAERRILARKLLDVGDVKTAYDIVARHGAESDKNTIEAEFHCGWIALRFLNDAKLAAKHFQIAAGPAETPVSASRTAYWQGRAAEALGDRSGAREHYEKAASYTTTYYGQIARVKIGLGDLPLQAIPRATDKVEQMHPVRGARMLYEAGAKDLAVPLLTGMAQSMTEPAQLDVLAAVSASYRDARAMVLIGKAAMQRGYPLDLAAFPLIGIPAYDIVGEPVERPMVYAIARQESIFDPGVMSHAGARGLMQLMPATAKNTAKRAGLPFDVGRLTSDPSYNATIGARHLRELLQEWRGSYILAFAAYNAGGGNVSKWVKAYGDPRRGEVDPVDWVERIPYSETRNYVQRVMENLQVYRQRLGVRTAVLISDDLQRGGPGARTPDEIAVKAARDTGPTTP